MSDTPKPANEPPAEDDLTAFLDGELDDAAAREMEQKLALDPLARSQAEKLKKTYNLLDYLPKPEPRADFATRTLTKIQPVVSSSQSPTITHQESLPLPGVTGGSTMVLQPVPQSRPWLAWVLWCVAAISTLAVGFFGHQALKPLVLASNQAPTDLARDYRMLSHLPLYLGVDDLEYLKQLHKEDLFPRDPSEVITPAESSAEDTLPQGDKLIELFKSFPESRQRQLRKLDSDLHSLPTEEFVVLSRTLEEYGIWLDQLSSQDRREILTASNADERLNKVKQTLQRLWREGLPKPMLEKLNATANVSERTELATKWSKEEETRREEWAIARRHWQEALTKEGHAPWPFSDPLLTKQIEEYIRVAFKFDLSAKLDQKVELSPACRLNRIEAGLLKELHEAGKDRLTYFYGSRVYHLAQRHPMLPEPKPGKPLITDMRSIPPDLIKAPQAKNIFNRMEKNDRKSVIGKWPDFAQALASEMRTLANAPSTEPLGPCRPGQFTEPVEKFLTETLMPKLNSSEKETLRKLEGKWPEYPQEMIRLAQLPQYDFSIPNVTLPGKPSLWAKYYSLPSVKKK
jgi:hypothetical protein